MLRTLTAAAAAATALLACAAPAAAQDPAPPSGSWSFAFGAGTDNRSKDASKSDGDAYVWGEAEWESASGLFYAGPGLQTIKSSSGSELELAVGAGLRPEVAGFDLDLNLTHKYQVDAAPGYDDGAWEVTADVKRSIGPASGRLRLQHSPDGTGSTEAWTWVEARLGWDFTDKLSASASLGRREQDNSVDYTGWNAGLTYALTRNLEAELRYHATDANVPGEQYADALVAGISVAF
ncbi:TorF family putative porin [Brevundimonas sp.]|uniref:TorF family putative porin n=1 Tax=Brevundimonas sp. TaxID=1871086 RepID=UPI002737BFEB|nr:TorF family putative porin [Brevundimonas sp.]MDP3802407.1 TorF family putative porin [Brevundimonas sp.]